MKIHVRIDKRACLAYRDCVTHAPEAFEVDDVAHLVGSVPLSKLVDAACACPTDAIMLIDGETGEQLAPESSTAPARTRGSRGGSSRRGPGSNWARIDRPSPSTMARSIARPKALPPCANRSLCRPPFRHEALPS